jgi:hypothetical protein
MAGIAHVLIECPLAVGNAICFGCRLPGRHLCLDLLVSLCFGDDVGQKLEVLYASNCVCCGYVSGMIQGQVVPRGMYSPTSRYWMFLLGLRSDLTTLCDCSTRCWRNISVATVITKAALLLQLLISSSWEMIFLTRATGVVLDGVASLGKRIERTYAVETQCL